MIRPVFIIAALLISSIASPVIAEAPASSAWNNAKNTFSAIEQTSPTEEGAMLFTGSSSVAMWRTLARDFAPLRVINRGISGSTLDEWAQNARLIISAYQPAAVIVYAGDNDIASGRTPEQVLDSFKRFTAELRKDLPTTPIVFLSLKPSPSRWSKWESMKKTNDLVKDYIAKGKNLVYVDTGSTLLDKGGVVRPELFLSDRLHLNEAGYRNWTKALKPTIEELHAAYRALGKKPSTKMPQPKFMNGQ